MVDHRIATAALLLLAGCASADSQADSEPDTSAGAIAARGSDSQASSVTYLGQLTTPTDGKWTTYALPAVHSRTAAVLDIVTRPGVDFDVNLQAAGQPPPAAASDLDAPPPQPSSFEVVPSLVIVAASTKQQPLKPVPPGSVNRDIPSSSIDFPAAAVVIDSTEKPSMDANGTISLANVERTDLGIRVLFGFPAGYVPGSAQISLRCTKGCK